MKDLQQEIKEELSEMVSDLNVKIHPDTGCPQGQVWSVELSKCIDDVGVKK